MSERFERVGLAYWFRPDEMPLVLRLSRVKEHSDEMFARLEVFNHLKRIVITRRINLMASPVRAGTVRDVINELMALTGDETKAAQACWTALLREACQSVLAHEAKGRPVAVIEGEIERPPPPAWLSRGLLLKNKPNCWLGASSTGKSTLAKAVCAYYASGMRFCDREMEQGVPLYLDWEDDENSFRSVVHDVCRNLGVWPLPKMLWLDMHGQRLADQIERLADVIDRAGVGLLILDAVAAAGGAGGEHQIWESIALEMEQCLGSLPPVTVLALDHVTGAEHRAQRSGLAAPVPIKARGAERKLEYLRNQWSLVTDEAAEQVGRHVVNWYHTKNSVGPKERPGFATEILHRQDEVSIMLRPLETPSEAEAVGQPERILAVLGEATAQTVSEVAWRLDGKPATAAREDTVRRTLDRWVERGQARKAGKRPTRYWRIDPDKEADQGQLITFPGGSA